MMLTGDNAGTAKRITAGIFYPFVLNPEVDALSMSHNSTMVAINTLLLKRIKLAGIKTRSVRPEDAAKAEAKPAEEVSA